MYRFMLLVGTGILCWRPAAAQEALPKAEVILEKFIEVTGGKPAYQKLHNQVFTGRMEFVGKGIKGTISAYKAEPDKSYSAIDLEGVGKIEEGTNGGVAWTRSALQGPRLKEGVEKAQSLRAAAFNAELNWRKFYPKAETAGVETVGDQECYKVVLTPSEGEPQTRYFDKKTSLLVKVSMTISNPMGQIGAETFFSDYKPVNNILVPHKLTQKAMGQEFAIVVESLRFNADIPKDRFELPEDIKALMKK